MVQRLLLLASALLLLAHDSPAAVLRGTVQLPPPPASAPTFEAYPGRASSMPGTKLPPRGRIADAVVYVEHVPASAESALAARPAAHPKLAQREQCFVPHVVAVAAGGVVDFPNQDPIYHNVFSVTPTKRFDLGKYPRGRSKSVTFERAGLVNVYCDIHSNMAAFVLVLPNHAFVQPDASGAFELPDLPPGHYTLKLWHPDFGTVARDVELDESSARPVELRY